MSYEDTLNRLNEIKIEDYIWIIYLGIIILSYYSNSLEKDYLINNNTISKEKYRAIMILIFSVLVIIYYYFLKDSYESIKNIQNIDETNYLYYLSYIASVLVFISGLIFLYIAYKDEELNVEIAFN